MGYSARNIWLRVKICQDLIDLGDMCWSFLKLSARPSWASFHMTVICGLRRFFEALSPLKNMKVNYDHDPNWLGMGNKHETSNKFKKLDRVHQSNIFQVLAHMFFTVTFTDKDPILRLPSKGFSRVSAWINKVMVWVSQSPMS